MRCRLLMMARSCDAVWDVKDIGGFDDWVGSILWRREARGVRANFSFV